MNIRDILISKRLYRDVIGLVVDYICGDKKFWKHLNKSVTDTIAKYRMEDNHCLKLRQIEKDRVNFQDMKMRFIHFINLNADYDLYNQNENFIANMIKSEGRSISIRSYLSRQHITAKLYISKLICFFRESIYTTQILNKKNMEYKMLIDIDYVPSVYKFGNINSVYQIMNNRWVGSISIQENFSLVLQELQYTLENKEKQNKIQVRQCQKFQTGNKFQIKNAKYQVINVYKNALRIRKEDLETKIHYFRIDEDQCVYTFVDKFQRYKYYTDNTIEQLC